MLKTNRKAYVFYAVVGLILLALSLIGIIFNSYESLVVLAINLFFGFFVLLINLHDINKSYEEVKPTVVNSLLWSLLRMIIFGTGLVLSALFLYFTRTDESKIRFLFLLLGLLPIGLTMVTFYLRTLNV